VGSGPEGQAVEGLRRWFDPAVLSAAGLAGLAGFGQFGVVALLGDIAEAFGEAVPADGVAAEVGMAGTTLGIGLAIIRLASVGSLPAAGVADRFGRRRVLIVASSLGLLLTVTSAASPTWWWFVAIFALGRPLLTGTNAVAGVIAAEETSARDRTAAIALVGAAYAVGTGTFAIMRAAVDPFLGFRGILALVAVPLAIVPLLGRGVREPERYVAAARESRTSPAGGGGASRRRLMGPVRSDLVPRLALICTIHLAAGLVTGPANTYLFLYGEEVHGMSPAGMSVLFVVSGVTGLAGLLVGRWSADVVGRRLTAGAAMAAGAVFGALTYSGSPTALLVAYPLMVLMASAFAPAAGALDAELFPTSMRSTASGWVASSHIVGQVLGIAAVGTLTDVFGSFAPAAGVVLLPVAVVSGLYAFLPETKGMELEESAPEHPGDGVPGDPGDGAPGDLGDGAPGDPGDGVGPEDADDGVGPEDADDGAV
jgi:MFS family permease